MIATMTNLRVLAPRPSSVVAEPGQVPIILGSASPRRSALLQRLGVSFRVQPCDLDEASLIDDSPCLVVVKRIARAKFDALAETIRDEPPPVLLTADTIVVCDGNLLGKPKDADDAVRMLRLMSGRWHRVVTAVCAGTVGQEPSAREVETRVKLRELSPDELSAYMATGEALDKAGALALQGAAGSFVEQVEGCWSNVVGLPPCAVTELLDLVPVGGIESGRCSVALCGRHGQDEADRRPAAGAVRGGDASTVAADDLLDDRKAET